MVCPEGTDLGALAARFMERTEIMLKPLGFKQDYFCGWFPPGGRRIETADGIHLFTLQSGVIRRNGMFLELHIQPAALELIGD